MYIIYIYIYEKYTVPVASVRLAQARPKYLPWFIFPLLLGTSTGNLRESFFGFMTSPQPHPLISELSMIRAPWPAKTFWLKSTYSTRMVCPQKKWFLCSFVLTRWEMVQSVASQGSCQVYCMSWQCPAISPYHILLLAKKNIKLHIWQHVVKVR